MRIPREHAIRRTPADRRLLGVRGEQFAAAHLERLGLVILASNVRTRHGEIDAVAFDERADALVFVEVKTRLASRRRALRADEQPLVALRPRQRARLRRLAAAWLQDEARRRPAARTIRFDAIGVVIDERGRLVRLEHLEGAW